MLFGYVHLLHRKYCHPYETENDERVRCRFYHSSKMTDSFVCARLNKNGHDITKWQKKPKAKCRRQTNEKKEKCINIQRDLLFHKINKMVKWLTKGNILYHAVPKIKDKNHFTHCWKFLCTIVQQRFTANTDKIRQKKISKNCISIQKWITDSIYRNKQKITRKIHYRRHESKIYTK